MPCQKSHLKWIWSGTLWVGICCFSRILFRIQKVFYIKKWKNSLSDLSHDARKSFSADAFYHFFFSLKDALQLHWRMFFCSKFCKFDKCFWGVVYMRDETRQKKRECMIKERRKPLPFLYRTIGRCYCQWNRSIWHPSWQRKQGSIFCLYPSFL